MEESSRHQELGGLELWCTRNIELVVIHIQVVVEAMRLDMIDKGGV